MKGVFYRCDTRHPLQQVSAASAARASEPIFTKGFDKRDAKYSEPKLRFPAGAGAAPDVVPESAVCFTRHFEAAPIFPVSDLSCNAWVYVLELDVAQIFNSQQKQYEYAVGQNLLGGATPGEAVDVLWPMFGQERAADSIAARDIVGAVEVQRSLPNGIFAGGTFKCLRYEANPGFAGTSDVSGKARKMIQAFVTSGEALRIPTCSSAVVASTKA